MSIQLLMVVLCWAVPEKHVPAIAEQPKSRSLDVLLKEWEMQSRRGNVLQIEFNCFAYDHVFETEKRSTGRLILGDRQWRVDFDPVKYTDGQTSNREGYRLESERPTTWLGDLKQTTWIEHNSKQIDVFHRSKDDAANSRGFLELHTPSYLRICAEHLKQRYHVSWIDDTKSNPVFKLESLGEPDSKDWKSITVMWSYQKLRVQAIRFMNPANTVETVYVVTKYLIDPPLDLQESMNPIYPKYRVKAHRPAE